MCWRLFSRTVWLSSSSRNLRCILNLVIVSPYEGAVYVALDFLHLFGAVGVDPDHEGFVRGCHAALFLLYFREDVFQNAIFGAYF